MTFPNSLLFFPILIFHHFTNFAFAYKSVQLQGAIYTPEGNRILSGLLSSEINWCMMEPLQNTFYFVKIGLWTFIHGDIFASYFGISFVVSFLLFFFLYRVLKIRLSFWQYCFKNSWILNPAYHLLNQMQNILITRPGNSTEILKVCSLLCPLINIFHQNSWASSLSKLIFSLFKENARGLNDFFSFFNV